MPVARRGRKRRQLPKVVDQEKDFVEKLSKWSHEHFGSSQGSEAKVESKESKRKYLAMSVSPPEARDENPLVVSGNPRGSPQATLTESYFREVSWSPWSTMKTHVNGSLLPEEEEDINSSQPLLPIERENEESCCARYVQQKACGTGIGLMFLGIVILLTTRLASTTFIERRGISLALSALDHWQGNGGERDEFMLKFKASVSVIPTRRIRSLQPKHEVEDPYPLLDEFRSKMHKPDRERYTPLRFETIFSTEDLGVSRTQLQGGWNLDSVAFAVMVNGTKPRYGILKNINLGTLMNSRQSLSVTYFARRDEETGSWKIAIDSHGMIVLETATYTAEKTKDAGQVRVRILSMQDPLVQWRLQTLNNPLGDHTRLRFSLDLFSYIILVCAAWLMTTALCCGKGVKET
mmetsp:Transcript_8698/g.12977  ORF Transcript_8698/g.12977 Transcript_8698/m.12977 type:complete len:406 (+) Transcript_8698:178-1395(+)|eukprot:CAMPEP_0167759570 /NCGR_PEP_ID=MMETSP0110_2-20121227/11099_1 /TAXON_ID=629695 /ORGANISM="Gymnochlora sp., Strain CCMP2014" /LENGTH=405 /DNA_ID=CAMNT_0007645975 /DNA_START=134 /DNA_END=1351 /DNA_ORIENTATION=-